ncbi:MAG: CinA family protein [Gemmatimonadetes bacterium]|nr:CinA family protein [Gemmatimonadota bacterium]MYI07255.1 CinA family protein [Gemmatimonadota bacterium]
MDDPSRAPRGGGRVAANVRALATAAARRGIRVATAESCTGGLLAKAITDLPGASAYFVGGVIAYGDDVKVAHLGVDRTSLEEHGAVSRVVALEMAAGAARRFGADVAMAVTGIAGPDGGTPEKPVGTVWMAVAAPDGTARARLQRFEGDRLAVRRMSVATVLEMAAEAAMYGPEGGDWSACETHETEHARPAAPEERAAGSPIDQ